MGSSNRFDIESGRRLPGNYRHAGYDAERSSGRGDSYYGALGYGDAVPDYTSRREHGENPYGYYGQYRRYRPEHYPSGGYDEGRVSTRRPDVQRRYPRGPKGYRRSDARIREDIAERLMTRDDIDASEVSLEVSSGVVRLEGSVPERRMKHAIEDVAAGCADVDDVENRITVRRR